MRRPGRCSLFVREVVMRFLLALLLIAWAAAPPAADAPASLPAFQGGGPLRGVGEAIAPPPYQVRWQFKAGDDEKHAPTENNPPIAGDPVYVADSNGVLHALSLADGKPRWTYKSEGGFATTPLVLKDRIYLGDLDGLLHCIAADKGTKMWTFESDGSIHSSANISPDGKVVVFGNDNGDIFGVDAST